MINLTKSGVVFDVDNHTYTLNGKELSGITGILKQYIFPDMLKGIPESVLARAAERGTAIHNEVEMYIDGFPMANQSQECISFIRWSEMENKKFDYTEFIVTDSEHFASAIDLIDSEGNLYDIKTTYELKEEYVRWQLSVYAYLIELQCGYTPKHLYALHLRNGECRCVEVERIPADIVKGLLDAVVSGSEWHNPLMEVNQSDYAMLSEYKEIESQIVQLQVGLKAYQERQDELKKCLLSVMKERGIKKWETDSITLTVKDAYERKAIDSKALQEKMPEVYAQFLKTSKISESLTIKVK